MPTTTIRNIINPFEPLLIALQPVLFKMRLLPQQVQIRQNKRTYQPSSRFHDSKLLASASWAETVKIGDTSTGGLQQTLEGHSGRFSSVAFSHDSKFWVVESRSCRDTRWSADV